ncbi:tetratricopeptide repeat protein [Aliidiomarina celeris]|uniref:tetratricopeptide repeat protein n=1 Tax=Aliidiomarina celeris TaxID=2249428 RepID=UPI000DE905A8|nr:tetratricopeptide repeat protein [Aliidiomarina celeris]
MKGIFKLAGLTLIVLTSLSGTTGCASTAFTDNATPSANEQVIQAAYQAGDLVLSERLLRAELKRNPNDSAYWRLLGQVMLRLNDTKAAEFAFLRALEGDPESVAAWHQLGVSYLRLATEAFIEVEVRQGEGELPVLQWLMELQAERL